MPENWGALEDAHVKPELIRALAAGDQSQAKLAARYGVTQQSVSEFAQRHAERIQLVRDHIHDEFVDMWSAQKRNRISVYQDQIEHAARLLADSGSSVPTAEMMRTIQSGLRAISEELGQLPGRTSITVTGDVHYAVEGVQLGALQ